jgi:hypothetical protein
MSTSPIYRHSENWSCKDIIKGYIIKVSQVYDRVYKSDYSRSTLAKKISPQGNLPTDTAQEMGKRSWLQPE